MECNTHIHINGHPFWFIVQSWWSSSSCFWSSCHWYCRQCRTELWTNGRRRRGRFSNSVSLLFILRKSSEFLTQFIFELTGSLILGASIQCYLQTLWSFRSSRYFIGVEPTQVYLEIKYKNTWSTGSSPAQIHTHA